MKITHQSVAASFLTTLLVWGMSTARGETLPQADQIPDALQAQFDAGEYEAVLAHCNAQIDALDSRFERYRPELFVPLQLRAEALFALGDYEMAIIGYRQALQVLRMNEGLHSAKQVPVFRRLAEAHQLLGNAVDANNFEEAAFATAQRSSAPDSTELLDDLHRLANWYLKAGYYTSARKLFERSRHIAEAHLPEENQAYVDGLEGIAETYLGLAFSNFDRVSNAYYSQFKPANMQFDKQFVGRIAGPEVSHAAAFSRFSGGEKALENLVSFWREQESPTKKPLIEALINLGDWHVRFRDPRAALRSFQEARLLMSDEEAQREFGAPKLLFMPIIENPMSCFADGCEGEGGPADSLEAGEIHLTVRLNNNGGVSRVTKRSSVPEDISAFRFKQETRRARYRPAIVKGAFLDEQDVPVVHHFRYPKPAERQDPTQEFARTP